MSSSIPHLTDQLASAPGLPHCENPYGYQRPFAARRRRNLQHYLRGMLAKQPRVMLIGEAPGYRGCRLTGIPFVSPQILAGLNRRLGQERETFAAVTEWSHIQREASATIVWRTIGHWQPLPLLWNVFPFHPHQANEPQSNRPPTVVEINLGQPYLAELLHLFPNLKLVAVGQKAAAALTRWNLRHTAVRHPSHGGATQFQTGLSQVEQVENFVGRSTDRV